MNILNKVTKEYLKMNKKRTLVTIIGVILTGAMISGVATLATSFQNFLVETQKQDSGNWEARFNSIRYENVKYIEDNNNYENVFLTQIIHESKDLKDQNSDMHLQLMGYEKSAIENMNIQIKEGNYATNSSEILVPTRYMKQYSDLKIGDMIELNINDQSDTAMFKIVGTTDNSRLVKSDKFIFVTTLNKDNLKSDSLINISFSAKNPKKDIYKNIDETVSSLKLFNSEEEKENGIVYNNGLLIYEGVNNEDGFNSMLIGVCGILVLVIAIGSIIVIYNSFAISVSERKKQFGMLASIGATKKQIKKMVLYEGAIIGLIGIPLGLLSGILGIGATLKVVDNLISPLFNGSGLDAHFELIISYPSLLIAIALIAITIYLSVFIPAHKASKISPIEAIRGSGDVKIKAKKVKTPKFLRKIYGIEGDMALKNLKRSRKRYRTTVISLTISIVLFLTFNGFVTYMFQGFNAVYTTVPYDYQLAIVSENDEKAIISDIKASNCADKVVGSKMFFGSIDLNDNNIDSNFKKMIPKNNAMKTSYNYKDGAGSVQTYILALDETEYNKYLKQVGLEKLEDNSCILINYVDGIYAYKAQFNLFNYKENDKFDISIGNYNDTISKKELTIAKVTDIGPYGVPLISGAGIIVTNENTYAELYNIYNKANNIETNQQESSIMIETENVETLENTIDTIMRKYPNTMYSGYSIKEQMEAMNNLKLIIQIFLYGFIVLISLIGISNIFNTITTNVNLRKREFANLKSIGMTDKAFNKMMNLECLFYGSKALLFGLPIGCVMCYLLSKAFSGEIMFMFRIPWSSIAIVIVAVYLIVFMTMKYAKNKIKKDNIVDVLRDDNI